MPLKMERTKIKAVQGHALAHVHVRVPDLVLVLARVLNTSPGRGHAPTALLRDVSNVSNHTIMRSSRDADFGGLVVKTTW